MADTRQYNDLLALDADALIDLCISAGMAVPPDLLDNAQGLRALLTAYRLRQQRTSSPPSSGTLGVPSGTVPPVMLSAPPIQILKNYTKPPKKYVYNDFVQYFNKRYNALSAILRQRKELAGVTSINRIIGKKEREQTAIIGIVSEKKESKTKHIILTVEDPTGRIEVWLSNTNHELQTIAREIVLDEVIGILGQAAGDRMFANSVIFPDIPATHELKKCAQERYAVFVGDVHAGAKLFMKDEFEKFLLWLSGRMGTAEQKRIAEKVGYVIFTGDLVEGVGIYPDQDQDLLIPDIRAQYREFARYIKMIPSHMQIVLISGNHDAGRLQEPQTPIYKDFAQELYDMPNVTILSNPCMFTINQTPTHPGFDVLLYHGYSLIYYANNVPAIREAGGQKATEQIMKLLLRKRHLAPTHGCNTYVPDSEEDPLVIDRVPDFFVTGHVHRVSFANYRGVTVLNASCWNEVSEEQEKRGLEPQPARLPVVNLSTREIRVMNFYHGSEEKKHALQEAAATPEKPV
jgi:DNA polymerase II small subunit